MHLFLQLLQRGPLLIPSLPPASDLSLGSLHELFRPAPLDEACWVGTCVALFLCRLRGGDLYGLPRPGLCVSGPVALVSAPRARPLHLGACGARLCSPGPASVSRGLWRLSRLPGPGLCVQGLVWTGSGSLCLPPASRGLWHLLPLTACPLSRGAYVLFFPLCCEGCVCCLGLYASLVSAPRACPLHKVCAGSWGLCAAPRSATWARRLG